MGKGRQDKEERKWERQKAADSSVSPATLTAVWRRSEIQRE